MVELQAKSKEGQLSFEHPLEGKVILKAARRSKEATTIQYKTAKDKSWKQLAQVTDHSFPESVQKLVNQSAESLSNEAIDILTQRAVQEKVIDKGLVIEMRKLLLQVMTSPDESLEDAEM